jgi:hypothetical protein
MKRVLLLSFLMLSLALSTACASGGGGAGGDEAKAKAAAVPVPASSPLAKIEIGMNDTEVRKILGEPDNSNAYINGKAFIPMYHGPDTSRSDWMYKGVGRVVFSRNQYSHTLKVIKLIHNPDEP